MEFGKLVLLVGFVIRIYQDAQSPECQKTTFQFVSRFSLIRRTSPQKQINILGASA